MAVTATAQLERILEPRRWIDSLTNINAAYDELRCVCVCVQHSNQEQN